MLHSCARILLYFVNILSAIINSHNNISRWPPKWTTQEGCQKSISCLISYNLNRVKFDLEGLGMSQKVALLFTPANWSNCSRDINFEQTPPKILMDPKSRSYLWVPTDLSFKGPMPRFVLEPERGLRYNSSCSDWNFVGIAPSLCIWVWIRPTWLNPKMDPPPRQIEH